MANCRLLGHSWADDVTLTATSAALAVANLQSTDVKKTWRSTTLADQTISMDFGEYKPITWLYLENLNNDGSMTVTVELSNDNFSSLIYIASVTVFDKHVAYWGAQHFFAAGTQARYLRVIISESGNSDGYLECGRIKVGDYFDGPNSRNVAIGPSLEYREQGALIEMRRSGFYSQQIPPKAQLSVNWQWAHDEDNWSIAANSFADFLEHIGQRDDVLISVYPGEDSDRERRHTVLGRMVSNTGLQGVDLITEGGEIVLYSTLGITVVGSTGTLKARPAVTTLPLLLARHVWSDPLNTDGVTTARTGESGYVSDGAGGWQNYAAANVIVEDGAVVSHPAYTRLDDRDDDLSGGAETLDLTAAGTGNYTLSVYGTAAVTVAAGTAVGTGFAQATEGSPVTFNLSTAGTVTLTLDSGTLDTVGGKSAKQVQKNPFATPIAAVASVSATQPVVPWPSGLVNDFVVKLNVEDSYIASGMRIIGWYLDNNNAPSIFWNSATQYLIQQFIGGVATFSASGTLANQTGLAHELTIHYSSLSGKKLFRESTKVIDWNDLTPIIASTSMPLGFTQRFNAAQAVGNRSNVRIYKVAPNISEAEVLAL